MKTIENKQILGIPPRHENIYLVKIHYHLKCISVYVEVMFFRNDRLHSFEILFLIPIIWKKKIVITKVIIRSKGYSLILYNCNYKKRALTIPVVRSMFIRRIS